MSPIRPLQNPHNWSEIPLHAKNCLLLSRALIKAILCFQSNLGTNTKKERCKFYNAWQCIQFWAEQRSLYAENLVGIKHVR